jgi:hypothetical protein
MNKLLLCLVILVPVFSMPGLASAHQPRLVAGDTFVVVTDPEVSKAYYGTLKGEPAVYTITALEPFALYVGVLVPDIVGQEKDVSAVITKDGEPLATLDGANFTWTKFTEPFGNDTYWEGPEYKAEVPAGRYEIRVSSPNNDSKYSLAVGEIEAFNLTESLNAVTLIPELKKEFFNKSPIDFILSPLGAGLIVIMFGLAFIFGFLYRYILRQFATGTTRGLSQNIGKYDRLLRVAIGVALLLWAITTTWSLWLLFFAGFAFFEAIFSWCGLYAALGRTTCPVE